MKNNIYADYSEKFVKNVILYGKTTNAKLYFDADLTVEVDRNEAKNIFKKGMLVTLGDMLCHVGTMKDTPSQEKTEFKIYNGSDWATYTSYNLIVTPVKPDYDDATGVITIPDVATTSYYGGQTKLNAGVQTPLDYDDPMSITAVPNDGYSFVPESIFSWIFVRPSLEVSPLEPTLDETNGVITIPDITGVIYKDGQSIIPAGAMPPLSKNAPKTITAFADAGYHLKEGVTTEWIFAWVLTLVEPSTPLFDTTTGIITIPDVTGVVYKNGDSILSSGPMVPLLPDTDITITAVPDEGYKFADTATTSWLFEYVLILVVPIQPEFNNTTGIITIPDKIGVLYTDVNDAPLDPGEQLPIAKDAPYIVKAVPGVGYKFGVEDTKQWEFQWSD